MALLEPETFFEKERHPRYQKIWQDLLVGELKKSFKLEFNKKFAIPIACVIFILFAFPIGLLTKRSGRSVGFGIGLLIVVIYWGMLFAGQSFGLRVNLSPVLAIWSPNFIIIFMGTLAFIIRGRR